MIALNEFEQGFFECALWSSSDESRPDGGDPLDLKYDIDDIAEPCMIALVAECKRFQLDNANDLEFAKSAGHAGHDFWLTRCGHGSGYWDGDYPDAVGERLTKDCERYGSVDLYVGDDGKIWAMGYENGLDRDLPMWLRERYPNRMGGG